MAATSLPCAGPRAAVCRLESCEGGPLPAQGWREMEAEAPAGSTVPGHGQRWRRWAAAMATKGPEEEDSCEYGSATYPALCGLGGIVSCGLTHTAVVPLDPVKCHMQAEPGRYQSIVQGFSLTMKEKGLRCLAKGWALACLGYSMQGLCKFGLYEVFKLRYAEMLGPEQAYLWRTSLYLAASASTEFFADIALSPMEAAKVRIQTQMGYANTLRAAIPKMYQEEGLWSFCKGVAPLWMHQIPYTMMKFACLERTLEALYVYMVPKPRSECTKLEQLGITFVAGYIAGLWKGLFARILMIGTLTALQWFIYDSVKVYFRLPWPPLLEMSLSLKEHLLSK
uniref:Solute carrier family 25 member 3 n=1 Tax=Apteryx owenii TaxID=8824 RepID=A0A8B9S4B0_APTOW